MKIMGKRFAVSLLTMILAVAAVAGATGVAAADYTCPQNTCSFTIPDYYSKVSSDDTSITFKDPNSGGVFAVILADYPGLATLDDAATVLVNQFAMSDGYVADPSGVQTGKISDVPARSFTFLSNNSSGTQVKTAVYFAVYKGQLYALTFATTPDQEDAFVESAQDVFNSWQFT